MMRMSLEKAEEFLKHQTPKEFFQQIATISEMIRRARTRGGAGGMSELQELRDLIGGPRG